MENKVASLEQRIEDNIKESAQYIKKASRKTFHMGGVHPEANKFAHSAPVETFPLPDEAVVYMTQHLGAPATPIVQKGDKVEVELPDEVAGRFCPVVRFECDCPPGIYRTGGMRVPNCPHPRYDPVTSDIMV